MEDVIRKFLAKNNGDGSGSGSGYGYGDGYGDGSGSGSGSGYGYGYGSGSGVNEFNGQDVYIIDGTQTLIDSVHGNYAKGKILNKDLTTTDCYIAKCGDYFAHGETLREAMDDAKAKYDQNKPVEERIADFKSAYPTLDTAVEHKNLYVWHNKLTGSCVFGRDQFVREHGLDKDNGSMSVQAFIDLTRSAYGGHVIQMLEKSYH